MFNKAGMTVAVSGSWLDDQIVTTQQAFADIQVTRARIIADLQRTGTRVVLAYLTKASEVVSFAVRMYDAGLYGPK